MNEDDVILMRITQPRSALAQVQKLTDGWVLPIDGADPLARRTAGERTDGRSSAA